jgi:hypothetical protein
MVPLGLFLLVPLGGVYEKMATATKLLLSNEPLTTWGGDLLAWYPEPWFLGAKTWAALIVVGPLLAYLAWRALAAMDPRLRRAFAALLAFGVVFAVYFRVRDVGWYFHFKTLAFIAPILVALAAAGAARLRPRLGYAALTVLLVASIAAARAEINETFDQLPKGVLALRAVDARLPPGASVRLDIDPQQQNWAAFWLHGQPLCSRRPLTGTSYPRVPLSRKADYAITERAPRDRPADAVGGPVMDAGFYRLWRLRADLPGRENCSREMVQSVERITSV